ncbi:MAG: GGDEF domain-containing protein, partial [Gemmatimonadetes bacterium]|nr:GGDEF domain-containing protein [Gemmatimonadota bacterium]
MARLPHLAGASAAPADVPGAMTLDVSAYRFDLGQPSLSTSVRAPAADPAQSALLVELDNGDALVITGAEMRLLPKTAGEQTLLGRAVIEAEEWRRKQLRALRRAERADGFTVFSEELNRATRRQEVFDAVTEHGARVAACAALLLFLPTEPGSEFLGAVPNDRLPLRLGVVPRSAFDPASSPGLIHAGDVPSAGPLAALAPVFAEGGARTLAYAPMEARGVLVLVERRADRTFEPEDWYFLRCIARQVEAALRRIELDERVDALALVDPLTGAASRWRFELLLEHSVAMARRGAPLSLASLDLVGLAALAERDGRAAAERALRRVAELLASHLRGSDTVARGAGDDFLVLLPGCDAAGARLALARLREVLAEALPFAAGVAEFDPATMGGGAPHPAPPPPPPTARAAPGPPPRAP